MSSEKRKIAYIDGKPYEIGANHTSILKFVKSYVGEKKVPTLCDDPNLAPYGACRVCSVEAVSYTHLRAHETRHDLVCRLLLEKKN